MLIGSHAREGVIALGGDKGGGVDRRLWRERWLLYRQGVTGWSALVAMAFSVLGKSQEPAIIYPSCYDSDS